MRFLRSLMADRAGAAAMEAALTLPFLVVLFIGMVEMYFYMDASRKMTTATQLTADLITRQNSVTWGTSGPATAPEMTYLQQAANFMMYPYVTLAGSAASGSTAQVDSNPTIDAASFLYANPTGANNLGSKALTSPTTVGNTTCTANTTTQVGNNAVSYCTGIDWEWRSIGAPAATAASTAPYTDFSTGCTPTNLTGCFCTLDTTSYGTGITANPLCLSNQSLVYVRLTFKYYNPISFFVPALSTMTAQAFLKPRNNGAVLMCNSSTTCQ